MYSTKFVPEFPKLCYWNPFPKIIL